MRTDSRRTIRAAYLSLLIAVSFLTTGGWFCADGSLCLPALSSTCCCGGETHAPTATTAETHECDTISCLSCRSAAGCGCYRDLPGATARLADAPIFAVAPAVLPGRALVVPEPPARLCLVLTSADPAPPPRFLLVTRNPRAPPAS